MRAVLLDLYGTLVEIRDRRDPYTFLAQAAGWTFDRLALMTEHLPDAVAVGRRMGCADADAIASFGQALDAELASIAAYDDVATTLAALKEEGLRLAIVSNVATPYIGAVESTGLAPYFDTYVFSCEVALVKPDPAIYREALQRLGVEPHEAIMVGDTLRADVLGPREVGIRAMHLCRVGNPVDPETLRSLSELVELLG